MLIRIKEMTEAEGCPCFTFRGPWFCSQHPCWVSPNMDDICFSTLKLTAPTSDDLTFLVSVTHLPALLRPAEHRPERAGCGYGD